MLQGEIQHEHPLNFRGVKSLHRIHDFDCLLIFIQ